MTVTALGERLTRNIRERAARTGAIAAVRLQTDLVRNFQVHRKSGDTQALTSVRLQSLTATTITYIAKAETPQAKWVNDGTVPHVITPKRNPGAVTGPKRPVQRGEPALVFFWARVGSIVSFRWVMHPGYRGDGWWDHTVAFWPLYVEDAWRSLA